MCTNYRPGSRDFIRERFGIEPEFDYVPEAYPAFATPILRASGQGVECVRACFGLIPPWARDTKIARNTYNARSETVAEKPSFRHAWRERQFCLVPMLAFYEPNYESGRPVRWRIERTDGEGFAVAGIWESWRSPASGEVLSFSMLTINADTHPLMRRFHAPGDEKRSVVVVDLDSDAQWLHAEPQGAREMLRGFDPGRFAGVADPRPRAAKSTVTAPAAARE